MLNKHYALTKTKCVFAIILFLYLCMAAFGYGSDNDIYRMIKSGRLLITNGVYHYSRSPGYLIPEISIGLLSNLGYYACNLLSVAFGFSSLIILRKIILRFLDESYALFVVLFIAINPYYILASTTSIDYVYSLFFCLVGLLLLSQKHYYVAPVFIAVCISSRLPTSLLVGTIYAYFIYTSYKKDEKRATLHFFLSGCMALIFTAILYIPSYVDAGYSMGFMKYMIGEWTFFEHFARFLYKNVMLIGLLPAIVVFYIVIRNSARARIEKNAVMFFASISIVANEILFFIVPAEISYLIPVLFVVTPMAVYVLQPARVFQVALIALLIINGFIVNLCVLDIHYDDTGVNAISATPCLNANKGVVISDISSRQHYFDLYRKAYDLEDLK